MQARVMLILGLWALQASWSLADQQNLSAEPNASSVPPAITDYFSGLDAIYRKGSTTQEIDDFMSQFHDDVKYIHVNYGANFDRTAWLAAFTRNHSAGRYTKPADSCSLVTNAIAGKNHHAIEYAYGTMDGDDCLPADDKRFLVLFGLTDGKLSLVQELW